MTIEILVPVAPDGGQSSPLSNRMPDLRGTVVGLLDNDWSSFSLFLDRLEQRLERQAIKAVKRILHVQRRNIIAGSELDAFAAQIDTAIIGLGA